MKRFGMMLLLSACALSSAMADAFLGKYRYAGSIEYRVKGLNELVPVGLATIQVGPVSSKKTCSVKLTIQKANQAKVAISGKLNVTADSQGLTGTLSATGKGSYIVRLSDTSRIFLEDTATNLHILAYRNYLEGRDAAAWATKLSSYVGTWNGEFNTERYGLALFNCIVSKSGNAKIKTYGWKCAKVTQVSSCATKLVTSGDANVCEIPVNFIKLTDKKNVSAAFNLILEKDSSGNIKMYLDPRYSVRDAGSYAISSFGSFQQGSTKEECLAVASRINDEEDQFLAGKAIRRPLGEYSVHGQTSPAVLYNIGDETAFGQPVIAKLGYPVYGTPLYVKKLGKLAAIWTVPKATKVLATGPLAGDNPSGLKLTYNDKYRTFKGSYDIFTRVNNAVKKYSARIIGVTFRMKYNGDLSDYESIGYAFCKGPRGAVEYDYAHVDPPNESGDEGDDDDE